jgi:magnesium chelatase family protein
VLFLDELPEFKRDVLEVMRQPLEDGFVTVVRVSASLTYPARFMLVAARNIQRARFEGTTLHCNGHMQAKQIRAQCRLSQDVKDLLRAAITQLSLSARAYDRILKLSRTIADLDERENIELAHVA